VSSFLTMSGSYVGESVVGASVGGKGVGEDVGEGVGASVGAAVGHGVVPLPNPHGLVLDVVLSHDFLPPRQAIAFPPAGFRASTWQKQ